MKTRDTHTGPRNEGVIALQLSGVGKTFVSQRGKRTQALNSIDLTVHQAQFVTLVGATGCGKTTLLNIIAGLDHADRGTVTLDSGMRLGRNMGYVFQHYTLFPWRTTLHNVEFGLQMRGVPRHQRKERARELLAKVGLSGFEKANPHELSGGMRQRAAIAQTLALQPKLLLMDEPFGSVDDATRADLQQMLTELWMQEHMTILFVTHNIDEAILLGSHVVVLGHRPGRIVRQFEIDLPRPRDTQTQDFTNLFIQIRQSLWEQDNERRDKVS